eukprot:9973299-Lingulodinium_polyedra.AAC.1
MLGARCQARFLLARNASRARRRAISRKRLCCAQRSALVVYGVSCGAFETLGGDAAGAARNKRCRSVVSAW